MLQQPTSLPKDSFSGDCGAAVKSDARTSWCRGWGACWISVKLRLTNGRPEPVPLLSLWVDLWCTPSSVTVNQNTVVHNQAQVLSTVSNHPDTIGNYASAQPGKGARLQQHNPSKPTKAKPCHEISYQSKAYICSIIQSKVCVCMS